MSLVEKAKEALEQAKIVGTLPVSMPTWEVNFFDKEEAQRMAWFKAKTAAEARKQCEYQFKGCDIYYVIESKYTLEEIEAYD